MDRRSLAASFIGLFVAAILWLGLIYTSPSFGGFGVLGRDGAIVVADSDVVSYSASRHEMTLTANCVAWLEAGRAPMGAFTILVNGEVAIKGTFVPPITSRSFPPNEVVITYPSFDLKYDTMKIQMGYPWPASGSPGVEDSALVAYFASTGRLAP